MFLVFLNVMPLTAPQQCEDCHEVVDISASVNYELSTKFTCTHFVVWLSYYLDTGRCRYKVVQYKMIFHTAVMEAEYQSQLNTLRPRQDGRHFADTFLNENVRISIKISLKG